MLYALVRRTPLRVYLRLRRLGLLLCMRVCLCLCIHDVERRLK